MTLEEYQRLSARSDNPLPVKAALQHGIIGILTEAGELGDTIKRHVFYGEELDVENIIEELGDLLWFRSYDIRSTQRRQIEKTIPGTVQRVGCNRAGGQTRGPRLPVGEYRTGARRKLRERSG